MMIDSWKIFWVLDGNFTMDYVTFSNYYDSLNYYFRVIDPYNGVKHIVYTKDKESFVSWVNDP